MNNIRVEIADQIVYRIKNIYSNEFRKQLKKGRYYVVFNPIFALPIFALHFNFVYMDTIK